MPRLAPHMTWSANCGQNASAATSGNHNGAMRRKSRTAMSIAATMAHRAVRRYGSTTVSSAAQKNEIVECATAAAPSNAGKDDAGEITMAPAARVGSVTSPPVPRRYNVDGTPLSTVAASHAQTRSTNKKPRTGGALRSAAGRLLILRAFSGAGAGFVARMFRRGSVLLARKLAVAVLVERREVLVVRGALGFLFRDRAVLVLVQGLEHLLGAAIRTRRATAGGRPACSRPACGRPA